MNKIKYSPVNIGNVYGRLKVVSFDKMEVTKSGQKIKYWLCECQCENKTIKSIREDSLKQGKTQSCGCLHKEIALNNCKNDLTGMKFNRLTVVSRAENKGKNAAWNCLCECGNTIIVKSNCLISNRTKSCGCLAKETIIELGKSNKKNLKGLVFGKLTVIEQIKTPINLKSKSLFWLCQCECGNKIIVQSGNLLSGNTQSCGCITSIGEQLISKYLKDNHICFIAQYSYYNCKNIKPLRFDFYLPNYNCCIEFDGKQHYTPVQFNGTSLEQAQENFEYGKINDDIKNNYCKDNNITLLRIPYWDINNIKNILDGYIKLHKQNQVKVS